VELPWLDDVVRAKPPQGLFVVLTHDEVRAVLHDATACRGSWRSCSTELDCACWNAVSNACRTSTVAAGQIMVRDGKGRKDRMTMLPTASRPRP
jgi:hypothetical protein